jgi:hypothetical protein
MAHDFIASRIRSDFAGPTDDEWNPMTTFPGVAFGTTKFTRTAMLELFYSIVSPWSHLTRYLRSIVTGENDKSIIRDSGSIECIKDLTNTPIRLVDEISISSNLRFADKLWAGHNWIVRRGQR